MKIIGQPEDYSEILQRVFYFSLATGFVSTCVLAQASPAVQALVDSVKTQADFGPIKGIKALYVIIPIVFALISRVIKLHDRISDILLIRATIDTKFFLYPLCQGSGVLLTDELKVKLNKNRNNSMYKTVYKYAGFKEPSIDKQLVRTAADNWGWFWALLESSFLLSMSAVILAVLGKVVSLLVFLFVVLLQLLLMWHLWHECIKKADEQVEAILDDPNRKNEIRNFFQAL